MGEKQHSQRSIVILEASILNDFYQQSQSSKIENLLKENVLPFMAFVQRSADQQERHGPFGRPLQKLS